MPKSIDFQDHSWWKRLLLFATQLIFFIALLVVLTAVGNFIVTSVFTITSEPGLNEPPLYDWALMLLTSFMTIFLLDSWQQKKGLNAYGFSAQKLGVSLVLGLIVSCSILLVSFAVLLLGGWATIANYSFQLLPFFAWVLFFLIQPLVEEVLMRSFLQTQLHRHFGAYAGLFFTAFVFTLLHSANDSITLLASIQIFAGGYLMGLLYLHTKNIWATFAMHASWNFLQSTILGFAVSGMETYSVFKTETAGPDWLTGGDFGLEGSVLTLTLILVAIVYFWKTDKNSPPLGEEELNDKIVA